MGLKRKEGWELRLADALEDARGKPFVYGANDCLTLAIGAASALAGVDFMVQFAGHYASRMDALRTYASPDRWPTYAITDEPRPDGRALVKELGSAYDAFWSYVFGVRPDPWRRARRGDVCKVVAGADCLGVCNGSSVAVLREDGLFFTPLQHAAHCWRIG